MSTGLIQHSTAANMVDAWQKNMPLIMAALDQIGEACAAMEEAFQPEHGRNFDLQFTVDHGRRTLDPGRLEDHETIKKKFLQNAWGIICDKIEIRKLMCQKDADKLNSQLRGESKEPLPDLTHEIIMGAVEGFAAQVPEYISGICKEVYEFLVNRRLDGYKTNKVGTIGQKVILTWAVEKRFNGRGFRILYNSEQKFNSLSNIFHLLDGKGPSPDYGGELTASINGCDASRGETTYFSWHAFENRNLHIKFKRMDLVQEMIRRCADRSSVNSNRRPSESNGFDLVPKQAS